MLCAQLAQMNRQRVGPFVSPMNRRATAGREHNPQAIEHWQARLTASASA